MPYPRAPPRSETLPGTYQLVSNDQAASARDLSQKESTLPDPHQEIRARFHARYSSEASPQIKTGERGAWYLPVRVLPEATRSYRFVLVPGARGRSTTGSLPSSSCLAARERGGLISTMWNVPRRAAPTFFAILSVCPDTPRNPYKSEQAPKTKRHLTRIECVFGASTYVDVRSTQ